MIRAGDLDDWFIKDVSKLRGVFAASTPRVSRGGLKRLRGLGPTTVFTYDRYGAYEPVPVLCHGSFWKQAVDELLLNVDLVCLDLSGFLERNEATAYELQRVIDRYPVERLILLCDGYSDMRFLQGAIRTAWDRMAAGSPNSGTGVAKALIAVTDRFVTETTRESNGQVTQQHTRLHPDRKQTRALAAWLDDRVGALTSPPRRPWRNPTAWTSGPKPQGTVRAQPRARSILFAVVGLAFICAAYLGPRALAGQVGDVAPSPSMPSISIEAPSTKTTPPRRVIVPTLQGLTIEAAESLLKKVGLVSRLDQRESDKVKGTVLGSSPAAGRSVRPGSTVNVFVASGATRVPNVVGLSEEQARQWLTKSGYSVKAVNEPSDAAVGTVWKQTPAAGEVAPIGTTVIIRVSVRRTGTPSPAGSATETSISPQPSQQGTNLASSPSPGQTP